MAIAALVIGLSGTSGTVSERVGGVEGSVGQSAERTAGPNRTTAIGVSGQEVGLTARSATCHSARKGLRWYIAAEQGWRERMGAESVSSGPVARRDRVRPRFSCNWTRRAAALRRARAIKARRHFEHWLSEHTLIDHSWWRKAVKEAQRVYPGTETWLMSCSAAEGGWGRWVGYGGQSYSTWLRDSDTVGGPMQYRWSTFKGHFRRSIEYVRERGFRLPRHLRRIDGGAAWRSFLGQALAGGWARYTGNDDSHWSANFGNGC